MPSSNIERKAAETGSLTSADKNVLEQFVYPPQRATANYVKAAKEMKTNGVKFGCVLDNHIIPARPGKVFAILGRPGMGKTSFMAAVAKQEAKNIVKQGRQNKEYIAFITWETPVEELEAFFQDTETFNVTDLAWGKVPDEEIIRASISRPGIPIWTIGSSINDTNISSEPMIVESVYQAIIAIYKEYGMTPRAIFCDYIQKIPIKKSADRSEKVARAVAMIRRLTVTLGTPAFVGCQARQVVDDRDRPIPTMRDAEWSATILQDADAAISIWRPSRTFGVDERPTIEVPYKSGQYYANNDRLLVVKLLKQRWESGSGEWALSMDMSTLKIDDLVQVPISEIDGHFPSATEKDAFKPLVDDRGKKFDAFKNR